MILIFADRLNENAIQFADRFPKGKAKILTCRDLSRSGWQIDMACFQKSKIRLEQKELIAVRQIKGMLSLCPAIYPQELIHIAEEDRNFVAAKEKEKQLENVKWCTTQFQNFIVGVNYRVHVVGEKVFATKIISEADDYRYANAKLIPVTLNPKIRKQCLLLSKKLQLPLCGIDFKVSPEGRWFCFEVNPSPAYSYYEGHTGQAISKEIVKLLLRNN